MSHVPLTRLPRWLSGLGVLLEGKTQDLISTCTVGIFLGRVIPVTSKLALGRLPARHLAFWGQRLDWLSRCRYTVPG